MHPKKNITELKKRQMIELREMQYWNRIRGKMEREKRKGTQKFDMCFEHNIHAKFCKDYDMRIRAIALSNGYEVEGITISSTNTYYTFAIK